MTEKDASQSLFNRASVLLASTRLKDLLTGAQREALIAKIQRGQRDDGGWSLQALGTWTWGKPAWRARAPGTLDASLLAKSDGYATGLIVYTLRKAGVPVDHLAGRKGLQPYSHWSRRTEGLTDSTGFDPCRTHHLVCS